MRKNLTDNEKVLGKGYNRHKYYTYVVICDGKLMEVIGNAKGEKVPYSEVIAKLKSDGAKKVWVKREYVNYYTTFC